MAEPIFFASPEELRRWLEAHHETERELLVGHHKAHTGTPSLTFEQVVREALCFGWIDGQVRKLDDDRYQRRITPRKASSRWSAVNVRLMDELEAAGLMREPGRVAFAARDTSEAPYSLGAHPDALPDPWDAQLRAHPSAAEFWDSTPPSYRKQISFWIASAKREATQQKRFDQLLQACTAGQRMRLRSTAGSPKARCVTKGLRLDH
ncbi:MAG: YdeI/OmpD-associated family protein [Solirubrobacteraceae bacterium]|nr:YdeI/OmpD-associated family protein [Solirubrobacteraceae bacterium]